MPEQITDYLKGQSGLTNEQRADLWDAFYSSRDPSALAKALQEVDAPTEIKADLWDLKAGKAPPEPARDSDLSNLAPEVQERIRGHRAALEEDPGRRLQADLAAPGVAPMGGPRNVPEDALIIGSTALAGPVGGRLLGAAARLPGMLGMGVRAATSPTGSAVVGAGVGADTLRRTGSPLSALEAGVGTAMGLRGAGAIPGKMGTLQRLWQKMTGGSKAAAKGAGAAARGAAPPGVSAGEAATFGVAPPPTASGGQAARGMRALGEPVPSSAQPVGASSTMGGTASSKPKIVDKVIPAKPQTPIGQARSAGASTTVPALPTGAQDAARMQAMLKVREGAAKLGLTPTQRQAYERAAKAVLDAQLDGTLSIVTPSGAPSTLAKRIAENYGKSVGLDSPRLAQNFIDGILKLSGQEAVPSGLGMAIRSVAQ